MVTRQGPPGVNLNRKENKIYLKSGLLNNIDNSFIDSVQKFWARHYRKGIDVGLHLANLNLHGQREEKLIPTNIMWKELIPYFNGRNYRNIYRDKNIYHKLINTTSQPITILKRVRGRYYSKKNNYLDPNEAYKRLLSANITAIIKPSTTNNGRKINKLEIKDGKIIMNASKVSLKDLENLYGFNFIIQEALTQHPIMSRPHPDSVNTLRMVTFRWNGEVRLLMSFARFGTKRSIKDNAGTGGVCCGITEDGRFLATAIDSKCQKYTYHPTTKYYFSELGRIPDFEEFKKFVIELHEDILHYDFISWDIVVGIDGMPIFLEVNFRGVTWLYQLACQKPLFGDLTEDVIYHIRSKYKKPNRTRAFRTKHIKKLRENK